LTPASTSAGTPAYSESIFAWESLGNNVGSLIQNAESVDEEISDEPGDHNSSFQQTVANIEDDQYQAGYNNYASIVYGAQSIAIVAVAIGRSMTIKGSARKVARPSNIRVLVVTFASPQKTPLQTRVMVIVVVLLSVAAAISSFSGPLFGEAAGDANKAAIAYRSNTGADGLDAPKYREWNPTSGMWGSELELITTSESPVRFAWLDFSSVSSKRVIVVLHVDGTLDSFACESGCTSESSWTKQQNIVDLWSTVPAGVDRPFDIRFEGSSGDLVLVYDKVSTTSGDELFYRIMTDASNTFGSETIINTPTADTTSDRIYPFIRMSANPALSSDEIVMIMQDDSNLDAHAMIWDGVTWGTSTTISTAYAAASLREEVIGIAYEKSSGHIIAVSGENANIRYREYTTSWQPSALVGGVATGVGNMNWITLKGTPQASGNDIFMAFVGDTTDFATIHWTGSAWSTGTEQDTAIDSDNTRAFDIAVSGDADGTGANVDALIMWGTANNNIRFSRWTIPNTFSAASNVANSGTHPWIQFANSPNPTTADNVDNLGAVLDSAFDISRLQWIGGTNDPTDLDDEITSDTIVTTWESFKVEFQKQPTRRIMSEQLAIIDSAARSITGSRSMSEQLVLGESIAKSAGKPLADQLAIAETLARNLVQSRSVSEQLGVSETAAARVTARVVVDALSLSDTVSMRVSKYTTDSLTLSDSIARFANTTRAVSDGLAVGDSASGIQVVFVLVTDSMTIDEDFADIALTVHLNLGEVVVIAQGFATNFTGFFEQVDGEGIVIVDNVTLTLDSIISTSELLALQDQILMVQSNGKAVSESMDASDSIMILVIIPPPPPPPVITTMPDLMMTETEVIDNYDGLTDPVEAVEVDGVWNIDSLDEQGLASLLGAFGMPVYDVNLEAISDDISNMTMIISTFKVSMNVSGQMSDDGAFLTPTLSDLPAGMQVMIPINVEASMGGVGNLDALGNMTISFTPAESASDFTMMIAILDSNPEVTADELPNGTPAFYIDISIVGNFTGTTPSDEAFFEKPPQITFTVFEEWAQEQNAERDSNNVPIIGLFLLDEGSGEWIELAGEVEPPTSAVGNIYTYTATLPHFSTFAVTAGSSTSDDSGRGSNKDRAFTRLLTESLVVSGVANVGIPAGSEGKIVIKDLTESLTLRALEPQPLHQRVITIDDVTVAVSVADVRSAATFGTAIATLNFEISNKGSNAEELVLRFWYTDPARGEMVYEVERTITVGAGESIVEEVKIPFSSPGLYNVMIEVESKDGTLSTTDIAVDVPWLTVYLYILIVIAIVIVVASIAYVIYAMRRSGLFITGGK
jgi:PGF-pre-PGF domain-containing protein